MDYVGSIKTKSKFSYHFQIPVQCKSIYFLRIWNMETKGSVLSPYHALCFLLLAKSEIMQVVFLFGSQIYKWNNLKNKFPVVWVAWYSPSFFSKWWSAKATQTKRATTVANTRAVFMLVSEVHTHTFTEVNTAFIPATYATVCVLALSCACCGSTGRTYLLF